MVGIRKNLTGHVKRVIPTKLVMINQQTHQLWDRQHRMRIIEVDSDFIGQIIVCAVQLIMTAQDVLNRGRGQEIGLA